MDWRERLESTVNSWHVQVAAGIILLLTTLFGELFQPHHGFIFIGLYWIAQALPNILQSLERIMQYKRKD